MFDPANFASWLMDKACGAAIGKSADIPFGQLLSLMGVGGPRLPDIANQLTEIQKTLTGMVAKLDALSGQLNTLLGEVDLSRDEILQQLNLLQIKPSIDVICNQYNELLGFEPKKVSTPAGRAWVEATATALYKGQYDVDQHLFNIHTGIVGGVGYSGVLVSFTNLLITQMRTRHVAPLTAYQTLELLYSELLGIQARGLLLYTEVLNWRDAQEATPKAPEAAATRDAATLAGTASPAAAAAYLANRFGPQIKAQVALFLRCVDRLVLSQVNLRTRRWNTSDGMTQEQLQPRQYLPASADEIYRRADFLARCTCPNDYPHAIVGHIVGDPGSIEALVDAAAKQTPRIGVGASVAGGRHYRRDMALLPPPVPMDVFPIGDELITHCEGADLNLPAEHFPAGEYLEWSTNAAGDPTCRPQTKVAVLRLGFREALIGTSAPDMVQVHSPWTWPNERMSYFDADFQPVGPGQAGGRPFASFVMGARGEPDFERGMFQGLPKFPNEVSIVPDEKNPNNGSRLMLKASVLGEVAGKVLAARFTVSERVEYGHRSRTHYNHWYYCYKIGTNDDSPSWVEFQHRIQATPLDRPVYSAKVENWVAITAVLDQLQKASSPVEIYLRHHEGHAGNPVAVTSVQEIPNYRKIVDTNLIGLAYWLDEVEITIMPASSKK